MGTYEKLKVEEDKKTLEEIYARLFKLAAANDFNDQHLLYATMNLKAGIVELEKALKQCN